MKPPKELKDLKTLCYKGGNPSPFCTNSFKLVTANLLANRETAGNLDFFFFFFFVIMMYADYKEGNAYVKAAALMVVMLNISWAL